MTQKATDETLLTWRLQIAVEKFGGVSDATRDCQFVHAITMIVGRSSKKILRTIVMQVCVSSISLLQVFRLSPRLRLTAHWPSINGCVIIRIDRPMANTHSSVAYVTSASQALCSFMGCLASDSITFIFHQTAVACFLLINLSPRSCNVWHQIEAFYLRDQS